MTLEDFVNELASHEFAHLLHLRVTKQALFTNALAISILESKPALDRKLTSQELVFLSTLILKLNAGNFTVRDFEAVAVLQRARWITPALFLSALGL